MIYPLNIFTPDPQTNSIRPFMIFLPFKIEHNIMKQLAYGASFDIMTPRMPFVLPMPQNGINDAFQNNYTTDSDLFGLLNKRAGSIVDNIGSKLSLGLINNIVNRYGVIPDPRLTQIYTGSNPRQFSGVWQFVPQNIGEALAMITILGMIKYYASPSKSNIGRVGVLEQPYIFTIIFVNPAIQGLTAYYKMSLNSYNINYFAQGYSSTFDDTIPKNVELSLSFTEYGIKTKEDWTLGLF